MSEFGYIPEAPEQSFGNNKGIFTPKDIYDLTRADKYTNYGQLELIETQTVSGASQVDFTDLGTYNVHFATFSNIRGSSTNKVLYLRVSNDSGVTYQSSGYQIAYFTRNTFGSNTDGRSTSYSAMFCSYPVGDSTNEGTNGYVYMYNLLDSSKYSFSTIQASMLDSSPYLNCTFGSNVKPTAETHNAIRFLLSGGTMSGTISLYGIKEYS